VTIWGHGLCLPSRVVAIMGASNDCDSICAQFTLENIGSIGCAQNLYFTNWKTILLNAVIWGTISLRQVRAVIRSFWSQVNWIYNCKGWGPMGPSLGTWSRLKLNGDIFYINFCIPNLCTKFFFIFYTEIFVFFTPFFTTILLFFTPNVEIKIFFPKIGIKKQKIGVKNYCKKMWCKKIYPQLYYKSNTR